MLDREELLRHGLDPENIFLHAKRIREVLAGEKSPPLFSPKDSCRLDNKKIFPLTGWSFKTAQKAKVGAFVPAAGVASRYYEPLRRFIKDYKQLIMPAWALDKEVKMALKDGTPPTEDILQKPKALLPWTGSGESFLEAKAREHRDLGDLLAEIYVTPLRYKGAFAAHLGEAKDRLFFEQDEALSTIRFGAKGEPIRSQDGKLSIVPAGHGALQDLFPKVYKALSIPKGESLGLFIRNIDNVADVSFAGIARDFFALYSSLLDHIKAIRTALSKDNETEATSLARACLDALPPSYFTPSEENPLDTLLRVLFHQKLANPFERKRLFEHPLTLFGLVKNEHTDIGGAPVIVDAEGVEVAICLEGSHLPKDAHPRLKDPTFLTHFNPVFLVTETRGEDIRHDNPFWLFAEKSYLGQRAYYHETALYEILGHSTLYNLVFIDLPRSVFHPHKNIDDTIKKQ